MRYRRMSQVLVASVASGFLALGAFPSTVSASGLLNYCNPLNTIFCDNFFAPTLYKDQTSLARWYRYTEDFDNAADYIQLLGENRLRLRINPNASTNHYSNADISTSEINNNAGKFLFGVNTRVDVRLRYSPNMTSDGTGSAKGSAGILFWNYFQTPVDPEHKVLGHNRDSFGFIWQAQANEPLPGFWLTGFAQGEFGAAVPYYDIDLSKFHTYSLERRHNSMKYLIDNQVVLTVPLNQPGSLTLPASAKLSVDTWVDNGTYTLNDLTSAPQIDFADITQSQWADIEYISVKAIN